MVSSPPPGGHHVLPKIPTDDPLFRHVHIDPEKGELTVNPSGDLIVKIFADQNQVKAMFETATDKPFRGPQFAAQTIKDGKLIGKPCFHVQIEIVFLEAVEQAAKQPGTFRLIGHEGVVQVRPRTIKMIKNVSLEFTLHRNRAYMFIGALDDSFGSQPRWRPVSKGFSAEGQSFDTSFKALLVATRYLIEHNLWPN